MVNPILKKAIMPSEEEPVDISMQLPLSFTEMMPSSFLYSIDLTSLLISTHVAAVALPRRAPGQSSLSLSRADEKCPPSSVPLAKVVGCDRRASSLSRADKERPVRSSSSLVSPE